MKKSFKSIFNFNFVTTVKNLFLTLSGTVVLAFGTGIFLIPFDLITGGVSGMGIILAKIFSPISFLEFLTADLYSSILNWILFFIGLIFLGKSFAAKTLVSTIVYPFALSLSVRLAESGFLDGFFNLLADKYVAYGEIAVVLASVFGGAAVGAGCALTFIGGGSTGGVDVIALVICKYFKRSKSSLAVFIIDATIVVLGMFVINNLVISLLGITSALVCAVVIDKVFIGESRALIAHVVSDEYEKINRIVIEKLDRTTTILDAVGGYSGKERKVIMVTFPMNRYAEFIAYVMSVDKSAFITVHRAHEINGEGWTYAPAIPDNSDDIKR